jgi:hypothetical protein
MRRSAAAPRKEGPMGVVSSIRSWWSRSQGGEVLRDFGLVHSEWTGSKTYQAKAKLRRCDSACCLQLQLSDHKVGSETDFNIVYLYFRTVEELMAPFRDALGRIAGGEGPNGQRIGPVMTRLLRLVSQEVVHHYGRIDHNPVGGNGKQTELTLLRGQGGYWLFFSFQQRNFFMWPASLIQALEHLVPEIQRLVGSRWEPAMGSTA